MRSDNIILIRMYIIFKSHPCQKTVKIYFPAANRMPRCAKAEKFKRTLSKNERPFQSKKLYTEICLAALILMIVKIEIVLRSSLKNHYYTESTGGKTRSALSTYKARERILRVGSVSVLG